MKKNVKYGVVLLAAVIIMVVVGSAFANSWREDDCSSCHSEPAGMSITTVLTLEVAPGETFQVDVVATGIATQDVFVLRIPSEVGDNDLFTIEIPSNTEDPGRIDDNDALDLDSNNNAIHAIYNITAPSFPGTFTLEIFAAQHLDQSISSQITVNVVQSGPGASIGAPMTTPSVPLADEEFTVSVNVTSEETISYVRLQYSLDNGTSWENVTMTEVSSGTYTGVIPGFENDQLVLWRIVAADATGIESTSATLSYIVGQIPIEPIEIPQFHYGWWLGAPALFLAYLGTALEYYDEERFTKIHGIMLGVAYILTTINVAALVMDSSAVFNMMNPAYLFDLSNILFFMHAWHVWLGIISMILGTLAFITHLGGWKTCNLGLPAVILWTILGIMGIYLGEIFVP
jgi:hypothetical protein